MQRYELPNAQMAVKANTVLKVLKTASDLTTIDILVRESIQNSLDAANKNQDGPVTFEFDFEEYKTVDEIISNLNILKTSDNDPLFERLSDRLKLGHPSILVLSDKGTIGLSGPIRTDSDWDTSIERRNFENLVFELGQNHNADLAGGSYGFGKSIYYKISKAGLVLFYSQTERGQRLAFCLISKDEQEKGKSTGICWWGNVQNIATNSFVYPITDKDEVSCEEILKNLNLEHHSFDSNETGTKIFVFGPDINLSNTAIDSNEDIEKDTQNKNISFLNEHDYTEKLKAEISKSVQKWYWPRMIETDKVKESDGELKLLKVNLSGSEIDLAPQYKLNGRMLIEAEKSYIDEKNTNFKIHQIKYHNTILGTLVFHSTEFKLQVEQNNNLNLNKVAMIRYPRMVVYYHDIINTSDNDITGIFLVNSNEQINKNKNSNIKFPLDNAFKESESSTHTEWNYQNIVEENSNYRNYVKHTLKKIVQEIKDVLSIKKNEPQVSDNWSAYSTLLGSIFISDEDGFTSPPFPPPLPNPGPDGKRNTNAQSAKSKKINYTILAQNFLPTGDIEFILALENLTPNNYKIELMSKGVSDKINKLDWINTIGKEFPLVLKNGSSYSDSINIIGLDDCAISFRTLNKTSREDTISITIAVIKNDTLIDFDLKQVN